MSVSEKVVLLLMFCILQKLRETCSAVITSNKFTMAHCIHRKYDLEVQPTKI